MKKGIHPDYHKTLFVDSSTGDEWMIYSTMAGTEKREYGGEQLPVVRLDVSSCSHPFWTGHARELDAEGRIDRFRRRYASKKKA